MVGKVESRVSSDILETTNRGTKVVSGNDTLGKEAFLQLLVSQMKNQDPFNTQDPSQYVEQMATFSSLEQMTNLNESMEYLVSLNSGVLLNSALSTTANLLGREVELGVLNDSNKVDTYSGTVKTTFIKENEVFMEVELDNGEIKEFPYTSLLKIKK